MSRSSEARPGFVAGILVGALGVCLLLVAFGLEAHAARAEQVAAGEPIVIAEDGAAHVVGVVEPGTDAQSPATCTVTSGTDAETIEVDNRQEAFEGVRAGVQIRASNSGPATVVCDRRVAVASGPVVLAYPLAGSVFLYPAYAALALLGFAYAWRRARPRETSSPVQPGDDEARSDLRRFTAEVVLGGTRVVAGFGAIVLGVVGLLALREGSPAALAFLVPAGILGAAALLLGRRRRRRVDIEE